MHLKGLRLKGFKSFPRQTSLVFEPGVGVIIGPNGSGKSNLADAVVWALGEQSPTTLRGASMQDVIFAGSDGRRAVASAEVELIFDNSDEALPLPTPEVSVMRRVTREGSSQYYINHAGCRLTDIIELMAPVGLGRELHSIIGQGKVEAFLAGSPEDRRSQIEEAAGLGAYKRRRERATVKLREVRRNLERAALLEREVGTQLTPLRRQASAAEKLMNLESEAGELRARLVAGTLRDVDTQLTAHGAERATADTAAAAAEAELASVAQRRTDEEEAFAQRLAEHERRTQRLLQARTLDTRLTSTERLATQRLRLLEEAARKAHAERQRLSAELATLPLESEAEAWPDVERQLETDVATATSVHASASDRLEAAREIVRSRRTALDRLAIEGESAAATAARLERRQLSLTDEESRLTTQVGTLREELRLRTASEDEATNAGAAAREQLVRLEAGVTAAVAEATDTHRHLQESEEAHALAVRELRALDAEADHLEAALRELHDVDAESLAVAAEFSGTAPLSAGIVCAPGYERALAAALSQHAGALAVPRSIDHWSLLEALRHADVGLVRLLIHSETQGSVSAFPGAVPLVTKVSGARAGELAAVLADVVLVDDLRSVPSGFSGLAVTREGEFYRPQAGQLGLAGGMVTALLLERRSSLEALTEKRPSLEAALATAAAGVGAAREAHAHAQAATDRAQTAAQGARDTAQAAERALAQARAKRLDAETSLIRDERALEAVAAERGEAQAAAADALAAAESARQRAESARPDSDAAEMELRAAEEEAAATQATLLRRRVELDERRQAAARAAAQRAAIASRVTAARDRLQELDRQQAHAPQLRDASARLIDRLAKLRDQAHQHVALLERDDLAQTALDRDVLHALAQREAQLRQTLNEAHDQRAAASLAVARLEDRRGELTATLAALSEELDCAGFSPPADDAEAAALRERLDRLARRREQIGPVNPLAAVECAELEERAAFLREQRRDLERSVADLEQLIAELTAQIDAAFASTFAAVRAQFMQMIALLFPGGRGSLEIVADAPDEPGGVHVNVKPAKKLGQRLHLLSGGERALVAIAFLMAIVLTRPSPLYILDEIEAALDDVNIGRLVAMLREYRERTQFLVITHQKRTMDAADVLYGVTMGPDGTSHVVSARMAQEAIERETRASGPHAGASASEKE
ncbi:MAG: chromosome segregation protein SMC [Thermoleophilia bacterium]